MSLIAQIEETVRAAVSAALAEALEKLSELEGRIRDLEDQVNSNPVATVAAAAPAKAATGRNVRAHAETAHAKGSVSGK